METDESPVRVSPYKVGNMYRTNNPSDVKYYQYDPNRPSTSNNIRSQSTTRDGPNNTSRPRIAVPEYRLVRDPESNYEFARSFTPPPPDPQPSTSSGITVRSAEVHQDPQPSSGISASYAEDLYRDPQPSTSSGYVGGLFQDPQPGTSSGYVGEFYPDSIRGMVELRSSDQNNSPSEEFHRPRSRRRSLLSPNSEDYYRRVSMTLIPSTEHSYLSDSQSLEEEFDRINTRRFSTPDPEDSYHSSPPPSTPRPEITYHNSSESSNSHENASRSPPVRAPEDSSVSPVYTEYSPVSSPGQQESSIRNPEYSPVTPPQQPYYSGYDSDSHYTPTSPPPYSPTDFVHSGYPPDSHYTPTSPPPYSPTDFVHSGYASASYTYGRQNSPSSANVHSPEYSPASPPQSHTYGRQNSPSSADVHSPEYSPASPPPPQPYDYVDGSFLERHRLYRQAENDFRRQSGSPEEAPENVSIPIRSPSPDPVPDEV